MEITNRFLHFCHTFFYPLFSFTVHYGIFVECILPICHSGSPGLILTLVWTASFLFMGFTLFPFYFFAIFTYISASFLYTSAVFVYPACSFECPVFYIFCRVSLHFWPYLSTFSAIFFYILAVSKSCFSLYFRHLPHLLS